MISTRACRAFTIVEAVVSVIVLGLLAVAVIRSGTTASVGQQMNADRSRGRLLAEELVAETEPLEYAEPSGAVTLGPDAGEVAGHSRALFDDFDDYHGLVESPPRSRDGAAIPGLTGWTRETTVTWVQANSPLTAAASESSMKRIVVTVKRGGKAVAKCEALRSRAFAKAYSSGRTVTARADEESVSPK